MKKISLRLLKFLRIILNLICIYMEIKKLIIKNMISMKM